MWMDIRSAIVADTVYSDGQLVAKDVSFTLPAVTMLTADVQAMGTMSMPVVGLLEDMEAAITKIGVDLGLSRLSRFEKQNLECRWVQSVLGSDGTSKPEGCKAFIRGVPKGIPGIAAEIGSPSENEMTFGVTRLQIFAGGKEFLLVDRLSQILRVDGKDYYGNINSLL
jgi:phage tail tube protein FII